MLALLGLRSPIGAVWLAALAGGAGAVRLLAHLRGSVFATATSATWTALAWDAAHGELYRPVLAPTGYGGTRYMPLLFLVHAGLLRLHVDPVLGAVVLMQTSVIAAAAAAYAAMRAADVPRRLALPFACATCATIAYQEHATEIRADYLGAAFALMAVACALRSARDARSTTLLAAVGFSVLAVLTKASEIAVIAPIAALLHVGRRRRAAWSFAVAAAVFLGAAIAVIQVVSAGHFTENLGVTLTAGMSVADLWRRGIPIFADYLVTDPFIAVPFAFTAWSAVASARRGEWLLPHAYWLTVTVVTIVILASRGTATNHMVEVHLASVLCTAVGLARLELPPRAVAAAYLALAVFIAAWSLREPRQPNRRATVVALRAEYGGPRERYLSLDPIIPLLSGERPVVLDAFYLDLLVEGDTAVGRDLGERVARREFDAIFVRDADWPRDLPVLRLFRSAYEARETRRPFVVLVPKR